MLNDVDDDVGRNGNLTAMGPAGTKPRTTHGSQQKPTMTDVFMIEGGTTCRGGGSEAGRARQDRS